MRAPLEKIELVDQYLSGTLTTEEQTNFINALKTDAELKQLLDIQQTLIQATKRKALKAEIKTTLNNINPLKKWWKWITGGAIIAGIVTAFIFMNQQPITPATTPIKKQEIAVEPAKKEAAQTIDSTTVSPVSSVSTASAKINFEEDQIDFNGLKTWVNPNVQKFTVNPLKGLTIEGKQGTLIIVPTDAFVDENDQLIKEQVNFQLVEATTLQDMVLYNLGTTADGKPLESGGMFYMDFTSKGKKVMVNPKRPLYVEVPTKEVKKGMRVFKGEVEQGKVNWKNPKPLKKYLVNVDFKLLDFLPQGFANEVAMILPYRGHKIASSEFVDSLYYSLGRISRKPESEARLYIPNEIKKTTQLETTTTLASRIEGSEQTGLCGIDPLTIKTIKTPPYSKTFLATREFEKRVNELHKLTTGNELLQLYINNLGKNLSSIDSMVALKLTGNDKALFNSFAAQGLTNIKDAAIYQDQLSAYYTKRKKEFEVAQNKLRQELNNKNKAELKELEEAFKKAGDTLMSQTNNTIITPLTINLPGVNAATNNVYAFEWASQGWVNIDCYLHLLDKGADEVQMLVKSVDGTREVYQWLNTINNLTPLNIVGDRGKALFPKKGTLASEEMKNTFCFAISRKNGNYQWFDLRYNPYQIKTVTVDLKPSTLSEIKNKLKNYGVDKDLEARLNRVEEVALAEIKQREILNGILKKNKELYKDNEVMQRLNAVAFRCGAPVRKLNLEPNKKNNVYDKIKD